MRQRVFGCFVMIFAGLLLTCIAVMLTYLVRFGFVAAWQIVLQAIPAMFFAVADDPWLIPAFFVVCLFLWSIPWGPNHATPGSTFRRGRRMSSYEEARAQTLAQLARRGQRSSGPPPSAANPRFRRRT